jgi:5-oxoprolinase (ATP-hydrolysing) subunit A
LRLKIDINCDLGESYGAFTIGNDALIMPNITSASIACGFHGGDPMTMSKTINFAKKNHVAVGAHPGFPDIMGFGRREMQLTRDEAYSYVVYQIGALQEFASIAGISVQHVKPHGAMYNAAARDSRLADGIISATKAADKELIVFAPPKSMLANAAKKAGLRTAYEVFADRAYNSDGSLVSRNSPNAIVSDLRKVVDRAVKIVEEKTVLAVDGGIVDFGEVHTICVHGDTLEAAELAKALKKGLVKAGVSVEKVGSFI